MADQGTLYVSFSGESSTPETNVLALSCADGSTRGPALEGSPPFKELRGLALAPNAKMLGVTCVKKNSLVFGFAPQQAGFAWDFCGLSITNTVSGWAAAICASISRANADRAAYSPGAP